MMHSNGALVGMVRRYYKRLYSTQSVSQCMPSDWKQRAALYIHWPYCAKRCTYCNFNKYIKDNVDHVRMERCLITESQTLIDLSNVKTITSIFFGGGTPSLALPSTLTAVIGNVRNILKSGAEVSMEVNPTTLTASRLKEFKEAGITRISVGVQTLNDLELQVLGREHTSDDSLHCMEIARKLFPGKTSIDLMYGLPGQTLESWQNQLDEVLPLCDDHISLYQLSLERGTALFKSVLNRDVAIATPELMAEMYELAVKVLEEHGYRRYEASNFAKEGAESEHNMSYWCAEQYIGVGPGAHGRFVPRDSEIREARIQTLEPEPWMYEVEKHGHATRKTQQQTHRQILEEVLMLGLRTSEGVPHKRWSAFTSHDLDTLFSDTHMVRLLQEEGYLILNENGLRCTDAGLTVVDSIVPELLNVLEKYFQIHELEASS